MRRPLAGEMGWGKLSEYADQRSLAAYWIDEAEETASYAQDALRRGDCAAAGRFVVLGANFLGRAWCNLIAIPLWAGRGNLTERFMDLDAQFRELQDRVVACWRMKR